MRWQAEVSTDNNVLGAIGPEGRLFPTDLHVLLDTFGIVQDLPKYLLVHFTMRDDFIAYCSEDAAGHGQTKTLQTKGTRSSSPILASVV